MNKAVGRPVAKPCILRQISFSYKPSIRRIMHKQMQANDAYSGGKRGVVPFYSCKFLQKS
jgi:hypothetical protein